MVELNDAKILDKLPGIPMRYIIARDEDYDTVRAQIPLALRFDTGTNSPAGRGLETSIDAGKRKGHESDENQPGLHAH